MPQGVLIPEILPSLDRVWFTFVMQRYFEMHYRQNRSATGPVDTGGQKLIHMIQSGFPISKQSCPHEVKEYFRYREDLSVCDGLILVKSRVLITQSLRREILECLHSAHQGVQGMKARVAESIFWPGITAAINDIRARCKTCNTIAPSHSAEPPITADPPQFPYEQVCADYFELGGIQYLAMADRYSGWLSVKCFPRGGASASALVSTLCEWLMVFGAPKELASDDGTAFMSEITQQFIKIWGIRHRVSSVAFPQSNCRAEVVVKTAKRLLHDNVGTQGSLDTDQFARALMQYRNTPLQGINLSPAQILLGRDNFSYETSSKRPYVDVKLSSHLYQQFIVLRSINSTSFTPIFSQHPWIIYVSVHLFPNPVIDNLCKLDLGNTTYLEYCRI